MWTDSIYNLLDDYYFLKHIRDLYHLIISNDDSLKKQYLEKIINPFCISRKCKIESSDELLYKIHQAMERNVKNINETIDCIGYSFSPKKSNL